MIITLPNDSDEIVLVRCERCGLYHANYKDKCIPPNIIMQYYYAILDVIKQWYQKLWSKYDPEFYGGDDKWK